MRSNEWDLARAQQGQQTAEKRSACTRRHLQPKPAGWAWQRYASVAAPEDIQPGNPLGIQPGLNLAPQKAIKGQPSGATRDACLAAHIESKIQDATPARNTDSPRDWCSFNKVRMCLYTCVRCWVHFPWILYISPLYFGHLLSTKVSWIYLVLVCSHNPHVPPEAEG